VDWRDTRIEVKPGAVACFGRDAVKAVTRRNKLHSALDAMLSKMNLTEADAPRLHAALDKLLDGGGSNTQSQILGDLLDEELEANQNRILHEPSEEEGDSDEEPAEAGEDEPHEKVRIPYDKSKLSLDALQRSLDKTFGADDGAALSRVMVMDSANDLRLGNPDEDAMAALGELGIRFNANTRARQPWFGALRTWVGKHPQGTKIAGLHQPTLARLLRELQTAA
jgi:hypothetical protein